VLLLLATVGVYPWSRIPTGYATSALIQIAGPDWYKRAMR
jgi:hypothetical protein